MDTNVDRIKTFLAAHPGTFFCNECLSIEAVPDLTRIQVERLTHSLHGAKPYRSGQVVCFSCGEVRQCIAVTPARPKVPRRMGTRADRLSLLAQARRLGATARRRRRPIYENPYRGKRAEAWRKGWEGASAAADEARLRFTSFVAELYDYLVRHDRDDGLTVHEITDGLLEQDSALVHKGLYHLCRKGLVRRLLPKVVGQRRTPQRYRAVFMPPEVEK